jgi:anti-sigma-K factor RskA
VVAGDSNLSPNIDNQEMRDYLLGTLEAARRTALEERILCDPDVYEELLVNEEELIDQYVAGSLSTIEKHQFETHFLITAERQKNLRFGRLLERYMNSHSVFVPAQNVPEAVRQPGKTAPAKKSSPFYLASFGKRPALAGLAAVVVVCLGIILYCLIVTRKPAVNMAQQSASRLMVVTLAPGSTRSSDSTKRVTVPPKGVCIQLELEIANSSFHNFKSQLFRESQALETKNELKMEARGDQHIVPFKITGEMLSPGDYQVKLSGVLDSGQDEFIDSYSFRVTTE